MPNDIIKQKREVLLKEGWVESLPEFDWDYFQEVSSKTFGRDLGYCVSKVAERVGSNPFNLFSEEVNAATTQFTYAVCPPVFIPQPPPATAYISATWPFNVKDYNSHIEAAFEELTYRVIIKIIEKLGAPKAVYQAVSNAKDIVLKLDPSKFDVNDVTILGELVLSWENAHVTIERTQSWNDNGAITAFNWSLYSDNIRELSSSIMYNIGLELNPTTYQLGDLDAEFKLNSFPEYIQAHTTLLKSDMGLLHDGMEPKYPERFNTIVVGPPGYGYC